MPERKKVEKDFTSDKRGGKIRDMQKTSDETTLDAHDTHCCIEHGCKYGEKDCPIENKIRKQIYLCEHCGLETEGYYGRSKRTYEEQKQYVDELWENRKPRPKGNARKYRSIDE